MNDTEEPHRGTTQMNHTDGINRQVLLAQLKASFPVRSHCGARCPHSFFLPSIHPSPTLQGICTDEQAESYYSVEHTSWSEGSLFRAEVIKRLKYLSGTASSPSNARH